MKMIYQFLPKDTKLKDITEEIYIKFCADIRNHGYAEETLHSINATFRKLINLAYKKKLISENILDYADNMKTKQKEDYKVVSKEDFDELDHFFQENRFVRLGVNNYPKYRLLFNILYYPGIRLGECLALTYADFETFDYYEKDEEKPVYLVPTDKATKDKHLSGMRLRINKAFVSDIKLTKDPKNFKKRTVPLVPTVQRLFLRLKNDYLDAGGSIDDKIFTWSHGACNSQLKKACKDKKLTPYNCHDFRHTYISNLIRSGVPLPVIEKVSGDVQATILKRYSHMFETDEVMVLEAMQAL